MLHALAHAGLAKVAALEGDVAATRRSYEQLFALWRDADATIESLREARRDYDRLTDVQQRVPVAQTSAR
jgi:hypothetical protein